MIIVGVASLPFGVVDVVGECLEANFEDAHKEKIRATRELLDALKAKSSPRFEQSRKERLDPVLAAIGGVHDKLREAIRTKFYLALLDFFVEAAATMGTDKGCDDAEAAKLEHAVQLIEVPFKDLKIDPIMSESQFEDLCKWQEQHQALTRTMAGATTAMRAQPFDLEQAT